MLMDLQEEQSSMRRATIALIGSVAWIGHVQGVIAQSRFLDSEAARRSVAGVADALRTFEAEDYIYNRGPRPAVWSRLIEADYSSDVLVGLLGDPRPQVRTLAIALIFSKEDPKLLTPVARLFSDTSSTFPVLLPTANADPRATATQSVGDVAKQMLGKYMLAAGMKEWRAPTFGDWATYDSRHRDRPYSLSQLVLRLSRISGMQSPFREDRRPMLLDFRKELDRLPPDDRNLYLLWLCHGDPDFDGGRVLATEGELVDAAKRLGRQKLLQIVDGRPPGNDPDLPANEDWRSQRRYRTVVSFILAHADRLFTRADEPFLAAIEQGQRDKIARGARADLENIPVEALQRARAMLLKTER